MVGSAIAIDLSKKHEVLLVDLDHVKLEAIQKQHPNVEGKVADVSDMEQLHSVVSSADLVMGAVPGFMGYQLLEDLIQLKKNTVDISFCPEDTLPLSEKAKEAGVSLFVDAGVAPGLSNLVLGYYNALWDLDSFKCMVGGLPKHPNEPWNYKAPFSPIDVIEEYTRPARFIRDGNEVCMDALTEIEEVTVHDYELEAFNSDGLRTLLYTMSHVPNVIEKTLRFRGHAEKIKFLRDCGLLSDKMIDVKGTTIRPLDITSKVLIDSWKLQANEPEFTVMSMKMSGYSKSDGKPQEVELVLYDEYDELSRTSSMARTTGYTATAVAEYFLAGKYDSKGIIPLELLGSSPTAYDFIRQYLAERNVIFSSP